jgi:hypothetical protein
MLAVGVLVKIDAPKSLSIKNPLIENSLACS